jgi:hypothetical protein
VLRIIGFIWVTNHAGSLVQPTSLSQNVHAVKSREGKNSAVDPFGLAVQNFWKARVNYVSTLLTVRLLQIKLTELDIFIRSGQIKLQ